MPDVISLKLAFYSSILLRGSLNMIRRNLEGVRVLGEDWDFDLELTDKPGGQNLDLTGYVVKVGIGEGAGGPVFLQATATLGADQQQADQGKATASFLAAATATLTIPFGGEFFYQINATQPTGKVACLASGTFRAQKSLQLS